MWYVLFVIVVWLLALLVVSGTGWAALRLTSRRPRGYWRRVTWIFVAGAFVFLFLIGPVAVGWLGSRWVGTRGDERRWRGPRLDASGAWQVQTKASLNGADTPAANGSEPANEFEVSFRSEDGVPLRGYYVSARAERPVVGVVMVHGLFRGGLELEPVGAMWHELGAAVLLLELRNHGGSGRRPATFGRDEARDVRAAFEWLASRPELAGVPIVLFGVSLGGAALALAVPELDRVAGVVVDAPMEDLEATAHRMFSRVMPQPFRSITFWWVEQFSDFRFAEVRPADAFARFPVDLPVLMIAAGRDAQMPIESVRRVFERLPTDAAKKRLWESPESTHGRVWIDDPDGYREQLRRLVERVRS